MTAPAIKSDDDGLVVELPAGAQGIVYRDPGPFRPSNAVLIVIGEGRGNWYPAVVPVTWDWPAA